MTVLSVLVANGPIAKNNIVVLHFPAFPGLVRADVADVSPHNVFRAVAFGKPAMPVDTHVFRVANRIGLTKNSKNVLETEKVLTAHFPKEVLSTAHHWLILHGRYVCMARNPQCEKCGISEICEFYRKLKKD